jgi:hypothetical protein
MVASSNTEPVTVQIYVTTVYRRRCRRRIGQGVERSLVVRGRRMMEVMLLLVVAGVRVEQVEGIPADPAVEVIAAVIAKLAVDEAILLLLM